MSVDEPGSDDAVRFERYRRTGDPALRNELIEDHLTLARGFARRYARRGVPQDDLEQVARIALLGAVERYDPERGVRFQTFAGRTIDGELKRYFRDKAWAMRVPRRYQDLGVAIRAAMDSVAGELGRTPTVPELAEAVGAEVDEVLAAMEASQAYLPDSLDAPAGGRDDPSPRRREPSTVDVGPRAIEDRDQVDDLLRRLPELERRVVELRFYGEQSQREIAAEVGVSQMQVSRLLRRSLAALRATADDPDGPTG